MVTLTKIRELVLSQEQELEKLIFEYFSQKSMVSNVDFNNISFNIENKKDEIKSSIELMVSQGNLADAKKLLNEYEELIGRDVSYYSISGVISLNENNTEKAFEDLLKGLELDNTNVDLLYNMGYLNLVKGNSEEALNYYNECIKYTNDADLICEVNNIIENLQKQVEYTLITLDLTKEEIMNFSGENKVIGLIENNSLKYENKYEDNGITICEVNKDKSIDVIDYLVRSNENCIILFNNINRFETIKEFKYKAKIAYYQNKNYYTDKNDYLNNNMNIYLEKEVCNNCDLVFTSNINVYNTKKIIERRDNVYFLDKNIGEEFTIDYILKNIEQIDEEVLENKLKEYLKNLDDKYTKALYLIASESNNLQNSIEVAKIINDEYKTEEAYLLYINLLNQAKDYNSLVVEAIKNEHLDDAYKAEIIYLNAIQNIDLINFIISISTKNYKMADLTSDSYMHYKLALYNFELNKFEESFNQYIELQKTDSNLVNSPLVNRNIGYLLYASGDENYERFYELYRELMKECLA